jgi:hypothetical protein
MESDEFLLNVEESRTHNTRGHFFSSVSNHIFINIDVLKGLEMFVGGGLRRCLLVVALIERINSDH